MLLVWENFLIPKVGQRPKLYGVLDLLLLLIHDEALFDEQVAVDLAMKLCAISALKVGGSTR